MDRDDIPLNPTSSPTFSRILQQRMKRRRLVQGAALGSAALATGCASPAQTTASDPGFPELQQGLDENLHLSASHEAEVLLRWGDPLFADSPDFDPNNQTGASQAKQFGFNNDYTGFVPLPLGSNNSDRGLLVVNHEYTSPDLMHPGSPLEQQLTMEQAEVDMMAIGLSVVEIQRDGAGAWSVNRNSSLNRRITPQTAMQLTGPAAGSDRTKTPYSPDGVACWGTYGNCAGGVTPWGTILSGEENVQGYFAGDFSAADERQKENYQRFGIQADTPWAAWPRYFDRWDLSKNPNEPMHVGYIVEIDPYDPNSVPKKRTALGRFKHEGCNVTINSDGYVVAYSGDDQRFEYLYRFVSKNKYKPDDRQANMDLLEEGTLYAARFDESGVQWLPLVFGAGPLTEENGFRSQADISLDTRKAADLLGATPMDRPEDVEVNPVTGTVFVMLTKNDERVPGQEDTVNPRADNRGGHIIEMMPQNGDHTAQRFGWEMFILAGDPEQVATYYHPDTSENGWFACPDNCAFDAQGNLWIATDGADDFGIADGLWVAPVAGPNRGRPRHFLRTPRGAELCGPSFTPDFTSFFCAVQHPGDDGGSFDEPSTRWPDFHAGMPPRPAVLAIRHRDGRPVGS